MLMARRTRIIRRVTGEMLAVVARIRSLSGRPAQVVHGSHDEAHDEPDRGSADDFVEQQQAQRSADQHPADDAERDTGQTPGCDRDIRETVPALAFARVMVGQARRGNGARKRECARLPGWRR